MQRFIFILAFAPLTVLAAEHDVCRSGCDFRTVQAAVDAAKAGDTLRLKGETFRGAVVIDRHLRVVAAGGRPVVDAAGAPVAITVRPGVSASLWGIEVTGVDGRAGIHNRGTLRGVGVYVRDNRGDAGGVLNEGTLDLSGGSVLSHNRGTGRLAGGLNNLGGTVRLAAVQFIGNTGHLGGGLANEGGTVRADGVRFVNNEAVVGGAIYNARGTVRLDHASVMANTASLLGAGIANARGDGAVERVSVSEGLNTLGSGPQYACLGRGC